MNRRTIALLAAVIVLGASITVAVLVTKKSVPTKSDGAVSFASRSTQNQKAISSSQTASPSTPPTNATFTSEIQSSSTDPVIAGGSFTIIDSAQPVAGWYVVHIQPAGDSEDAVVVLHQPASGDLSIVAGPGTAIPLSTLQASNTPQAVLSQVPVYDDSGN